MSLIIISNHENKEIDIVTWFFKSKMKQEECTIEEVVASCLFIHSRGNALRFITVSGLCSWPLSRNH